MLRVLGLIPARGGSKGVPRKNIRNIGGKPLLAYTAETALSASLLSRVILSTDDDEIAQVGRDLGLDVPFIRPAHLAQDDTPTYPVVIHALETLNAADDRFDAVCLLQPTSPLRSAAEIDGCIRLLEETGADSVVTVRRVPDEFNPSWVFWKDGDDRVRLVTGDASPTPRRQELTPAFHRDGSVYVTRCSALRKYENLYGADVRGYETGQVEHVNIDSPDDWASAASILESQGAVHAVEQRSEKHS